MKNNFEEKMKRVEEIAAILDNGEATIDESIALFSEGAALIKQLNTYLDEAEETINSIINTDGKN